MDNKSTKQLEQSVPIAPETEKPAPKEFSDGFKRFIRAADPKNDPVVMILKCHLLAEFHMDKLLVASLPRGDVLVDDDRNQLSFSNKLLIVESLNILGRQVVDSLRKLNTLRNNCSHEQDYEIVEGDIDKIGRPFGTTYLKRKKETSEKKDLLFNTLMMIIAQLDFEVDNFVQSRIGV